MINQEWGICVRTSGLVAFLCLRFAHCSTINLFNQESGNKLHLHLYKIKNYKVTIFQNCQINQPEALCFRLVNLVVLKNCHFYGKTGTCIYLFKISSGKPHKIYTGSWVSCHDVISFISCVSKRSFKITLDIFRSCTISHVHDNLI